MTLRVIGEGSTDVGSEGPDVQTYQGDIPLILSSILRASNWKGDSFSCDRRLFSSIKVHGPSKSLSAEARKIVAHMEEASNDGCALAVLVVDVRKEDLAGRKKQARAAEKYLETEGIDSVIIGLAVHEIEAWILADEAARSLLSRQPRAYPYSGSPEDDPDPTSSLAQILGECLSSDDAAENELDLRARMIDAMRPDVVSRACPLGFRPFLKAARKKLIPLFVRKKKKNNT